MWYTLGLDHSLSRWFIPGSFSYSVISVSFVASICVSLICVLILFDCLISLNCISVLHDVIDYAQGQDLVLSKKEYISICFL